MEPYITSITDKKDQIESMYVPSDCKGTQRGSKGSTFWVHITSLSCGKFEKTSVYNWICLGIGQTPTFHLLSKNSKSKSKNSGSTILEISK